MSLDISTLSTLITITILFNSWHCSHLRSCVLQAAPVFIVIIPAVRGPRLALTGLFLLYIRVVLVTSQLAWVYTLYTDQYFSSVTEGITTGIWGLDFLNQIQMYTYKYMFPVCNRLTKESKLINCTENKFHFWSKNVWVYVWKTGEFAWSNITLHLHTNICTCIIYLLSVNGWPLFRKNLIV